MEVLKYIDALWRIGEWFHQREKTPGTGATLLMWCWFLDALFPLLSLARVCLDEAIFFTLAVPGLIAFPLVFCRLRYTERRRRKLLTTVPCHQPGRRLLRIWAVMIGLCLLESFLLLRFGVWQLSPR